MSVATWAEALKGPIVAAAARTGLSPITVACQWGLECGWSTEGCYRGPGTSGKNNYGGIMADGRPADFPTVDAFVNEYVATIDSYKETLGDPPSDITGQCVWLGRSQYNGDHHYDYEGRGPGSLLEAIVASDEAVLAPILTPPPATRPPLTVSVTVEGYGTGRLIFR